MFLFVCLSVSPSLLYYAAPPVAAPAVDKIIPIIKPYEANASQKINIKTIPTNNFGCCAFALTPASPIIPIAIPAAKPDKPHAKPEDKCAYP